MEKDYQRNRRIEEASGLDRQEANLVELHGKDMAEVEYIEKEPQTLNDIAAPSGPGVEDRILSMENEQRTLNAMLVDGATDASNKVLGAKMRQTHAEYVDAARDDERYSDDEDSLTSEEIASAQKVAGLSFANGDLEDKPEDPNAHVDAMEGLVEHSTMTGTIQELKAWGARLPAADWVSSEGGVVSDNFLAAIDDVPEEYGQTQTVFTQNHDFAISLQLAGDGIYTATAHAKQ